jgi:ELP3 family radical SAM enzyme/protein acetyltransferase
MACSITKKNNNIEIEDLLLNNKYMKDTIINNEDKYKQIIYDIKTWIDKNSSEKMFNYSKEFKKVYGKIVNKYRIFCKKNVLVYFYRKMIENKEIESIPIMWSLIQKRAARNISGVTVITVLTSPYPDGQKFSCKHNCYYCPNEPDQPRSYLKSEPAVSRANRNNFDPILQMNDRLKALMMNGHEIDKLEIIIEGGTYTEYPKNYLENFHRDLIYAANTYFDINKREPYDIDVEIYLNKRNKVRIIGICIETRPDTLFDNDGKSWLPLFRKWGVTRVQLGVQHTNNNILNKINRGHTFEQACEGVKYLKDNCFKVDIHLMPDLPGSYPEIDKEMFDIVFKTPVLQPDQIKIYPCEVVPWTIIQRWYQEGKYKPYAQTNERSLLDVVKYAMEICPPWIRLPRVIRDIPLHYIEAGNMYPNLRQMLTDELIKENKYSMDIRARECGRNTQYNIKDAEYFVRKYDANDGVEYFISCESNDNKCIFGFIRLRFQSRYPDLAFEFLKGYGLIRELHVYGNLVPVGYQKDKDTQHKGIGKKLLSMAEEIAFDHNLKGVVVISGIGVMEYYKKLGFYYKDTFMVKDFNYLYRNLCRIFMVSIISFIIYLYLNSNIIIEFLYFMINS